MFAALVDKQLEEFIGSKEADLKVLAVTRDVYQSLNILREVGGDTADPRWQERAVILESLASTAVQEFGYEFFFITSADGKAVYSTDKQILGTDLSGRDYVQGALAGRTTWSEIFYSDVVQENVQSISCLLYTSRCV